MNFFRIKGPEQIDLACQTNPRQSSFYKRAIQLRGYSFTAKPSFADFCYGRDQFDLAQLAAKPESLFQRLDLSCQLAAFPFLLPGRFKARPRNIFCIKVYRLACSKL